MPLNDVLRHRMHALAGVINSHRIAIYSFVSLLAVSVAIANALRNYSNFYSVAISLSKSNRSVLALANFGFIFSLLCGHIVQRIFFGALRANEVERLYDRLWFFITESLLAFTIFRDEFDIPFALMFGFLLFVKSFHWLAGDRIEWMDQRPYPGPSPLFHLRITVLFAILCLTDFLMFLLAVQNTIAHGVGGMVLFASEYGILLASVLNTISKYLLSTYELRRAGRRGGENAPPWENKSMWVFYIELATDFLKLTTYLVFFTVIITFYGLPLNIVRDVYITARSFITRLRALHRYQTATRNMDERYPNATADELSSMSDRTCIICREEMILPEAGVNVQAPAGPDGPNVTPKKLPCGHIFHFHCLRSWLERQQSCPTCRRTVLDAQPSTDGQPVPRRVNNPIDAQNQNVQVGNPLGNPLGLVGRLFGPPAQAPVPLAVNQNMLRDQANFPAQLPPGVTIHYHIQYQPPRNQHQPATQPLLQPPPPFAGFPGPDGVWQRWAPNDIAAQEPPPDSADPSPGPAPQSPIPTPTVPGGDERPQTPREAAALAALRRLNPNNNRPSSSSQPTASQSTPEPPSTDTNLPISSSNTTAPSDPISNVPQLIPLYDYTEITPVSPTTAAVNGRTQLREQQMHPILPNSAELGNSRLRQHQTQHQPVSQDPVSLLPPTLTEDQLVVMDRLTREAIDERLRVLEGVSSAVYRCIDDLMRMRSALPTNTPVTIPSGSSTSLDPEFSANQTHPDTSNVTEGGQTSAQSTVNGQTDRVHAGPSVDNEVTAVESSATTSVNNSPELPH
ncbi:hypothetical protein H0H81_008308 [Sphagnurus paluster]|uniref:RING-type E3 ubiquitin transferase n=1 Tax=Sphagnurus paluster TaxID=117069 RepID=A0A9P7K4Y1_9AGAR|nr:hypothetical protein H0H81_008308 [Sphagnurus paluster]